MPYMRTYNANLFESIENSAKKKEMSNTKSDLLVPIGPNRIPMKTSHQNKRVNLNHPVGRTQQEMVNKFRSLQKAATRRRQPIDLSQIDTVDLFEDDGPDLHI